MNRPELLISPSDDEDPSGLSAVLLEDDVAHERSLSFSLYLTRKPSSDVTVRISSDISGEVSILDEVRVFTPENYDMIQSVHVAGMMDSRADGDCPVGSLSDMSSEDAVYDGRHPERKVSVTDIDKVGIELSHDSLETDENGKSVNVRASLASIPYASVTVPLSCEEGAMLRVSAQLRTMPRNPVTLRPVITDSDGRENDNKIVIMDGYDLVLNEKDISLHEIRLKLLGKPDKDVFVKAVLSGNDIKMSEQIMTIHLEDWNKETVFNSTVDNSVADNDRTAAIVFEILSKAMFNDCGYEIQGSRQ